MFCSVLISIASQLQLASTFAGIQHAFTWLPWGTSTALPSRTVSAGKIVTASDFPREHRCDTTLMTSFSFDILIQNIQLLRKELREREGSSPHTQYEALPAQQISGLCLVSWGLLYSWHCQETITDPLNTQSHNNCPTFLPLLSSEGNIVLIHRFYLYPFKLLFATQPTLNGDSSTKGSRICPNPHPQKTKAKTISPPLHAIRVATFGCILGPSGSRGSRRPWAAHFALGQGSSACRAATKHVLIVLASDLLLVHINRARHQWRLGILQSDSDMLKNVAGGKACTGPFMIRTKLCFLYLNVVPDGGTEWSGQVCPWLSFADL